MRIRRMDGKQSKALADITRDELLTAIRECIRLGTEKFLRLHGYGLGRYVVKFKGRMLPSKAIVGVAAARAAKSFSGGLARLGSLLKRLGFMFVKVAVVALIACSKTKAAFAAAARDLYTGDFFRKGQAYADKHLDGFAILSAKHGLLDADDVVAPYNERLSSRKSERAGWHAMVLDALRTAYDVEATIFVLICGSDYREGILAAVDIEALNPFIGCRGLGDMKRWLAANT